MTDALLNYAEAAGRLRIKPDTLQRWVAADRVPHLKYFNGRVYFTEAHMAAIFQMFERGVFSSSRRKSRSG
jgi:predicted site-specific integrase-resolvase